MLNFNPAFTGSLVINSKRTSDSMKLITTNDDDAKVLDAVMKMSCIDWDASNKEKLVFNRANQSITVEHTGDALVLKESPASPEIEMTRTILKKDLGFCESFQLVERLIQNFFK